MEYLKVSDANNSTPKSSDEFNVELAPLPVVSESQPLAVMNSQDNHTIKTIPFNERDSFEYWMITFGGSVLAFNAGFVNGCTILYTGSPSSHVTGITTHAGLVLGDGKIELFFHYMAFVTCFVFGAAITGAILPDAVFQFRSEIGPIFIIGSILFLAASLCGLYLPYTELDIYFAVMGCGLQNGLTTKFSGNLIRTTHMTGLSTDIGLLLGRIMMGEWKDLWKLKLFGSLYLSFLLGGVLSVVAVEKTGGGLALLINFFFFLITGITYSIVIGQRMKIPFWRALFGCYVNVGDIKHHNIIQPQEDTSTNPLHDKV